MSDNLRILLYNEYNHYLKLGNVEMAEYVESVLYDIS